MLDKVARLSNPHPSPNIVLLPVPGKKGRKRLSAPLEGILLLRRGKPARCSHPRSLAMLTFAHLERSVRGALMVVMVVVEEEEEKEG